MTWLQLSNCTALLYFFFFFSFFKLVVITTNQPWLEWHRLKTFIRLGSAPSLATKAFVQLYSHMQWYCSTPANRFRCEKSVDFPLINESNCCIKLTVNGTSVKEQFPNTWLLCLLCPSLWWFVYEMRTQWCNAQWADLCSFLCILQVQCSTPRWRDTLYGKSPPPSIKPLLKFHYKHIFCSSRGGGSHWFTGNIMYKRSRLQQCLSIQKKKDILNWTVSYSHEICV